MTFEPEASPEDFANVWQGWLPLMREGEEVIFVARRREDRQFVGVGGAHNLRSHTPELGIWVKEGLHGGATAAKSCSVSRAGPPSAFSRRTLSTRWPNRIPPAAARPSRWAACWPAAANASSMTPWSTTCRLNIDPHRATARLGLFLCAAITAATACGFVLMIEACRVKQLRNSNMIILLPAPPPVSARPLRAVLSVKAIR